ncbi:MAG TPA: FMN-binding negative transcriptional regulator [Chitinophagaceae bacterium]|jgi:transcriptional regulator|nr:FMN-binding negative transcriptional regulator [Chitinophagaceae bacterium]
MYNLPYFKEKDDETVLRFMKEHPFATLIGAAGDKPVATQVPLLFEEREGRLFLRGHIMRQTDHHKAFVQNEQALVLFTGAHTYVSASWYTNPQQGSTWNYMSVQARGTLRFLEESDLLQILEQTTTQFENNPDSPASFRHLPQEYIDRLVKAIVGIEVEVAAIENTFKLSQNRDRESYEHITRKLEAAGGDAGTIAAEMKARKEQLYSS